MIILSERNLKHSEGRKKPSPNSCYESINIPSKTSVVVINPFPRSFNTNEKLTLIMGKDTRSDTTSR